MRILPEWRGYDTEIKELQEKLSNNEDEVPLQDPSSPKKQKHVHKEL